MRLAVLIFTIYFSVLAASQPAIAGVKERHLRPHVSVLASDEFQGRKPGTAGEKKTIEYIAQNWAKAKLQPAANDGSWFAPVPLVQRTQGSAKASFYRDGRRLRISTDEIVLIGRDSHFKAQAIPVVFGGYGVKSDGRAIGDMTGKLVMMLASQPNYDAGFADQESMSISARQAALVDAGAKAVIIVADGGEGNWKAIKRSALKHATILQSDEKRAELHGAVSSEYAISMISSARYDWDKLRGEAKSPDFSGRDLRIGANLDVTTIVRRFNSMNVIGKIEGRKKDSGAVLYMAHWDHLGICRPDDADDKICNGALDNASGIAVLTEVARALAKKRHDRDIYFVATTAEEDGLLGAYSFVANPPMALGQIVLALNIDTIAVTPAGSKVAIIGRGTTELDPIIESIARKNGRKIDGTKRANSFLRRQDGWALVQKGVPALMVNGSFSDFPALNEFLRRKYHGPGDEYYDGIDLSGAAEDADLHIALGKYFASQRRYRRNKTGG